MGHLTKTFLFFLLLLPWIAQAQPKNAEPGKCYAKTKMPVPMKLVSEEVRVFKGDYSASVVLDSLYFYYDDEQEDLVYLGTFNQLTISQQLNEDKFHKLVEVQDPAEVSHYTLEYIEFLIPGDGEQPIGWEEVVCKKDRKRLMNEVRKKLVALGYMRPSEAKHDHVVRLALLEYQDANRLPMGELDIKTIHHLRIKY